MSTPQSIDYNTGCLYDSDVTLYDSDVTLYDSDVILYDSDVTRVENLVPLCWVF